MYTIHYVKNEPLERTDKGKETIHSGHFMVSHFEAEEQDDEDNVAVPIPEVDTKSVVTAIVPFKQWSSHGSLAGSTVPKSQQQVAIDTSLSKLFQCMSLAYRQKLTSPKWNRFRGIRLRWKDKIRLNNVIWRCWHLQFVKKENTLICQFASPLDVDTHNKPEAIVLEGKYWKRKLAAVTAEYKKWRMFYRNNLLGHTPRESIERLNELDHVLWDSNSSDNMNMMVDEDYMDLMSDTLFSTITNQPFVFPDSREIAKAGLADFIQPSLGPLQPNLEDYMDTFDPLQEFMNSKLPTVPEEQTQPTVVWDYLHQSVQISEVPDSPSSVGATSPYPTNQQVIQTLDKNYQEAQNAYNVIMQTPNDQQQYVNLSTKSKMMSPRSSNQGTYAKALDNSGYGGYSTSHNTMVSKESQQQSSIQEQMISSQQFRQPSSSQGYKFTEPSRPNIKFSSHAATQHYPQHTQPSMMHASSSSSSSSPHTPYHHSGLPPAFPTSLDEKLETRRRGAPRGRGRSRSTTREPLKRPPLISAISDPSLITPTTNVLLTHLLSNNSPHQLQESGGVYAQSRNRGSCPNVCEQIRIKEEGGTVPILSQATPSTSSTMPLILPSQITITPLPMQSVNDPLILNTYSNSNSPIDPSSQHPLHSPTSSQGSVGSPSREGSSSSRDRRVGHIHAEQKRRYNIKNGFDMIHALIPHLNQNPNAKLSKAAMLQKGAEYIKQLRTERLQIQEEMDSLKQQIESLNQSISNCQSMLPATGAPVSRRRDSKMKEMFEDYVARRTMENWKFWIFSLICRPLLDSFNNFVSTASFEELYSSTLHWVEQHCTLVDLRPVVLNSLRYLCTKTDILSDPDRLPDEARSIVLDKDKKTKKP